MTARLSEIVLHADPAIEEQWRWNSPVWTHNGLVRAAVALNKDASEDD